MLVDDSIVRGTTSARTIRLLREAGAAEVHYRISAPPFAHPCYFGTDIPDEKDLIATGHTVEEINKLVGFRHAGLLERRACAAAGHPQQVRVLHRLLYRQVPRGPAHRDDGHRLR